MITRLRSARIIAHRGFSSRQPEMTLAAYQDAIAWSIQSGVPLSLECDVRFTRDHKLVCLHDDDVSRTSNGSGLVEDYTLAELKALDFGSWKVAEPTAAQRSVMSLADLFTLVQQVRRRGAAVSLSIETKHPNHQGLRVERRVCQMLAERGWDRAGSPVRLITFSVPAAQLLAELAPRMKRTLLIADSLDDWADGVLPTRIREAGVAISLLRRDPDFVARARAHGNAVHSWTVNKKADLELCRRVGVAAVTTDDPARAWDVLGPQRSELHPVTALRRRWLSPTRAA